MTRVDCPCGGSYRSGDGPVPVWWRREHTGCARAWRQHDDPHPQTVTADAERTEPGPPIGFHAQPPNDPV